MTYVAIGLACAMLGWSMRTVFLRAAISVRPIFRSPSDDTVTGWSVHLGRIRLTRYDHQGDADAYAARLSSFFTGRRLK